MIPRSSRSQLMSDPATATDPSSAYVAGTSGPPSRAATVVMSPCFEWTGASPVCINMKQPVP